MNFRSHMGYVHTLPNTGSSNKQLFYVIEILDEAIRKGVQAAFHYQEYGTDKRLHFRQDRCGHIREYIVNPYQMAAVNGRYYLICNLDKYDEISNYRLDRIADIRLLSTPVKEQAKVKGLEHGLNLPQHMAEHIYMFAGESIYVTFRADKIILNDIMDWFFGADFSNEQENTVDVTVKVNRQAMFCWAMQYGPYVEVLKPSELREELGQSFAQIAEIYEKGSSQR